MTCRRTKSDASRSFENQQGTTNGPAITEAASSELHPLGPPSTERAIPKQPKQNARAECGRCSGAKTVTRQACRFRPWRTSLTPRHRLTGRAPSQNRRRQRRPSSRTAATRRSDGHLLCVGSNAAHSARRILYDARRRRGRRRRAPLAARQRLTAANQIDNLLWLMRLNDDLRQQAESIGPGPWMTDRSPRCRPADGSSAATQRSIAIRLLLAGRACHRVCNT